MTAWHSIDICQPAGMPKHFMQRKKITQRLLMAVLSLTTIIGLAACGAKGNGVQSSISVPGKEITASELLKAHDYNVNDFVTLCDYNSISISLTDDYEVGDDDVREYVESDLTSRAQYKASDKTVVESGDTVCVDYTGSVSGTETDAISATDYYLTVGSGTFMEGFEESLIGKHTGETYTADLTLPDNYLDTELAGKPVSFSITVKNICEKDIPGFDDLTDDYIQSCFVTEGYQTVDEYLGAVRDGLTRAKEMQKETDIQKEVCSRLVDGSEVTVPDDLVNQRMDDYLARLEAQAKNMGMQMEDYITDYYGSDSLDDFRAAQEDTIRDEVREQLVLEALVSDLGVSIDEADYEAFVDGYISDYGYTEEEFYSLYGDKSEVQLLYAENEALKAVCSAVQVTD